MTDTSTDRIVLYLEGQDLDPSSLEGSGFTHAILSFIHVADDNLPVALGLSTSSSPYYLIHNSSRMASATSEYASNIEALDDGSFPPALRSATEAQLTTYFKQLGYPIGLGGPLSNDLKVVTLTPGQSWGILDRSNEFVFRVQTGNTGPDGHPPNTPDLQIWDPEWVDSAQLGPFWTNVAAMQNTGIDALVSIGGGGVTGDWNNLVAATAEVTALFEDLLGTQNLKGIDLDNEGVYSGTAGDKVADAVATFLRSIAGSDAVPQPQIFTGVPYAVTYSWYLTLLPKTTVPSPGKGTPTGNLFSWWNLQVYEGAGNYSPGDLPPFTYPGKGGYSAYVAAIPADVGVDDAGAFLVPGWNAETQGTSTTTRYVQTIVGEYPTTEGAFVWKLKYIEGDEASWVKAMVAGLRG